ncbi:MAG: hypothetical protein ACYC6Y_08710 [Thermoguttaceae bacterium]
MKANLLKTTIRRGDTAGRLAGERPPCRSCGVLPVIVRARPRRPAMT